MIRQRRPAPAHPQPQSSPAEAATAATAAVTEPTLSTPAPRAEPAAISTGKGRPTTKMNTVMTSQQPASSPSAPAPAPDERRPLLLGDTRRDVTRGEAPTVDNNNDEDDNKMGWVQQNKWIVLAIASGACAAFNGVFAKLTTTDLTTSFAQGVARVFHLGFAENVIEYIVRAVFFGLNLVFNGIMWTLFTQALAKGHSTTQVSIMNTSSNFVITAMLGLVIFSESLPPLWWAGAALLVAGNVIIGSKDESSKPAADEDHREGIVAPAPGLDGRGDYEDVPQIDGILDPELKDDEDEDILELGELRE